MHVMIRILMVFAVSSLFVSTATSANAAAPDNTPPVKYVAVLDFVDKTTEGKWPLIGRDAAAAVFNQIKDQHAERPKEYTWDVVPRDTVVAAAQQMHLELPPVSDDIRHLGQQLQLMHTPVSYVLTGEVKSVTFDKPHKKVTIELQTLAWDQLTGLLVNGALVHETNQKSFGAIDATLVSEAIEKAAFKVVNRMSGYRLPTGIIMTINGATADISLGADSGIRPGQEFFVTRNAVGLPEQIVGKLRVTEMQPDMSRADILENQGITAQDRVRLILKVTDLPLPTTPAPMLTTYVLTTNGPVALPEPGPTTTPTGVSAVVTYLDPNTPCVRVQWSDHGPYHSSSQPAVRGELITIVEYNIYRSKGAFIEFAGCVGPTTSTFLDTVGLVDGVVNKPCVVMQPEVPPRTNKGEMIASPGASPLIVPLQAGETYRYEVTRVVRRQPVAPKPDVTPNKPTQPDKANTVIPPDALVSKPTITAVTPDSSTPLIESDLSGMAGPVTPINRPSITAPQPFSTSAVQINIAKPVSFTWQPVHGATQYQLQVSDSPDFKTARTYYSPIVTDDPKDTQPLTRTFDVSPRFPPAANQQFVYSLYVRVGARNGSDNNGIPSLQAVPTPQSPLTTRPQDRFIFSPSVMVQGVVPMEAAPAAGGTK